MLFNFIVLLVIVLATAFLATQGLLSAVLAFVTGSFSAILALGLFEPMQGMIEQRWPSVARGVTFLILYMVIFGILRFAADYAIPKNIKLPKLINAIGGGVVGFFAALVVVGSAVLGLEMLPVHTTILGMGGDQEYSTEARMQGGEQGQVAVNEGISMWPQRFALAMIHGASGRSMGGEQAFGAVHPDLPLESYGYRNVVQYGSNPVLPQDLLKVDAAYASDAPDVLKKCNIPDSGKALVVRLEISKGTETPKISCDPVDSTGKQIFRMTPTQIRVVTSKGEQRYPIGYLENGVRFTPTMLDSGRVFDDYVNNKVIEEWVFQLDKDEKAQFIEVKQLARVPLTDKVKDKPFTPMAESAYPRREYAKNHGSITVTMTGDSGPLAKTAIYLVPQMVPLDKVRSALTSANKNIENAMGDDSGPWSTAFGKDGVPSRIAFRNVHLSMVNVLNQKEDNTRWFEVIPAMMFGGTSPDGMRNQTAIPAYFQKDVVSLLGDNVRLTVETGTDGKALLKDVAPGSYNVISAAKTASGTYYVWVRDVTVAEKAEATCELTSGNACFSLTPLK